MNNHGTDVLDAVLDRQKQAWLDGSQPSVEEILQSSSLAPDPEVLLDLIYNEIVLREELGERPALEEYSRRYPQLLEDLKLHFEVHRAIHEIHLLDTRRVQDGDSLQDVEPALFDDGPRLNDYEIVGELGRGGMGIVYKARHRGLKRVVALKMFQPGRIPSPRELVRFRAEAEAIARLQHPNIVQIFEVGQVKGLPFLALEWAEKGTLAQKLQEMPLPPRAAAELIETLARAIHHAHEQHIVHRDLKPANVLFARDGIPKITDFGLAKMLQDDADSPRDATRSGEPIGTPRYMAPEQAAGQPDQIGPATDVYALGTLLYECLTGQVPFVSASTVETMQKIRQDEPASPRRLQPSIPRDLETICLRCLYKQPGRRYPSALALAEDLRRFLRGEPIHARPTPAWERVWKWGFRHPTQAVLVGLAGLMVVAGLVLVIIREHRLTRLREEVIGLVTEGKDASARQDEREAKAKFLTAMAKVKAEPALGDLELMVAGWLDHSLRGGEKQRWKLRNPPPLFDERRDEAFLLSVILDPLQKDSVQAARQAIHAALEFAPDPGQREQLVLLDADMILRQGDAAGALALLDQTKGISSRFWHNKRAACLERLGRKPAADLERLQAEKFPPRDALDFFWSGADRYHQQDFAGAILDLDKALSLEPDHFMGRFFQAASFLHLKRPGEAKVALTACLAQRPSFVWSYLLRGEAYFQLAEHASAAQDLQRALTMNPHEQARKYGDQALASLRKAVQALPQEGRKAFWEEKILTDAGLQPLRDLPAFRKNDDAP